MGEAKNPGPPVADATTRRERCLQILSQRAPCIRHTGVVPDISPTLPDVSDITTVAPVPLEVSPHSIRDNVIDTDSAPDNSEIAQAILEQLGLGLPVDSLYEAPTANDPFVTPPGSPCNVPGVQVLGSFSPGVGSLTYHVPTALDSLTLAVAPVDEVLPKRKQYRLFFHHLFYRMLRHPPRLEFFRSLCHLPYYAHYRLL